MLDIWKLSAVENHRGLEHAVQHQNFSASLRSQQNFWEPAQEAPVKCGECLFVKQREIHRVS